MAFSFICTKKCRRCFIIWYGVVWYSNNSRQKSTLSMRVIDKLRSSKCIPCTWNEIRYHWGIKSMILRKIQRCTPRLAYDFIFCVQSSKWNTVNRVLIDNNQYLLQLLVTFWLSHLLSIRSIVSTSTSSSACTHDLRYVHLCIRQINRFIAIYNLDDLSNFQFSCSRKKLVWMGKKKERKK